MSSSVDVNLIASLNNVTVLLNHYFGIVIFIFGIIGNVLNCFVFAQQPLRSNPSAFFFLVSSIANITFILMGFTARMLVGWIVDATYTTDWLCKLCGFLLFTSRTIALWLIMLTSVDRWLMSSSNVRYRQMSTMTNAYRNMILILSLSALLYVYLFYCYQANLTNGVIPCFYSKTKLCRIVTDMFDVFITVGMSVMSMTIFGVMTISNIRQTQRRLRPIAMLIMAPTANIIPAIQVPHQQRLKKIDRHLLMMLFFQVTVLTLLSVPYGCVKIYLTFTSTLVKSPLQIAVEAFVSNFTLNLAYLSCGIPFYIYTLCGGRVFRSALLNVVKYVGRKMRCLPN